MNRSLTRARPNRARHECSGAETLPCVNDSSEDPVESSVLAGLQFVPQARATTWRTSIRRCIPTGPDRKWRWRDVNLPACYGISTGLPRSEKQDAWGNASANPGARGSADAARACGRPGLRSPLVRPFRSFAVYCCTLLGIGYEWRGRVNDWRQKPREANR